MADEIEVVEGEQEFWEKEDIPDTDWLYYRIHKEFLDESGEVPPGAFRNNPAKDPNAGMSCDWERYSHPERLLDVARKPPEEYAIVKLHVGKIRTIEGQLVEHSPDYPTNRAHTDVFGKKTNRARLGFLDACIVVIPVGSKLA